MPDRTTRPTRRFFLASGAAAALGTSQVLAAAPELRVGLIGCGGRGLGAVKDFLTADPNARLVAVGDAFVDPIDAFLAGLGGASWAKLKDRIDVPPERQFAGLSAFEKVIAAGIDIVLLATPSGFRPLHLEAAIAAGKHVFAERAVAIDAPGARKVIEIADQAARKSLSVVVGHQRRYQDEYRDLVKRVRDGAIGELSRIECHWGMQGIWFRARKAEWAETEFQLRNWFHFLWASGDLVIEQLTSGLDVANWAIGDHPLKATGRCSRNPAGVLPAAGDIRDQFALTYTYPRGITVTADAWLDKEKKPKVQEAFTGSKGSGIAGSAFSLTAGERTDRITADGADSPYLAEQKVLSTAIRNGKPVNDLKWAAETALTAVMGRMAAYLGKEVTWEQALASTEALMPKDLRLSGAGVASGMKPVQVTPPTSADGRYAVLVGVNDYDHEKLPPLSYAVNDATELAAVLQRAGYKVALLSDATGKTDPKLAPTRANIERHFKTVLDAAKKGDTVLVGLAGHGLQFEGDKDAYFCPSDARPFKDKTESLVSLGKLYRELDASFAGVKVLLVDACRDDPAAGRGSRGVDADAAPPPPKGVAALFSCSAGQRAFEHESLKHGVFFHHVLEGLRGKAKDEDGEVTFNALSDYVAKKVKADVPRLIGGGAKQLPNQKGEFVGGSPTLLKVGPK